MVTSIIKADICKNKQDLTQLNLNIMRNRVLFLLCFLWVGLQAFAQISISGKVFDEGSLELPGVNVAVKGTTIGTLTNSDGTYAITDVPGPNSVLVFSYVGFETQEIQVGNQKVLNVKMIEDQLALDEVVVIGYGTARKRDLSGSISSVKMSESPITQLANPNSLVALTSKVAGFDYSPTSSAGGDNSGTMTIRGRTAIPLSTNSADQSINKPLLVVDGTIFYGSISEIATTDIESIDVLKDASAAAIYGSRAANGVIIITTKKGKSGKPTVNLNAYYGFSAWSRKPQLVTDKETFLNRRRDAMVAAGTIAEGSPADPALVLSKDEYDAYEKGIWTDWIDEVSQYAPVQNYNLSVSGNAGDKANYYVSGGYMNQEGVLKGNEYSKFTIMAKLDTKVTDWLTIGIKGNYLNSTNPGTTPSMQMATWMSPFSFTYNRLPGFENWPEKYPQGTEINPFWGSDGSSYYWTTRESKSFNINGVGYAQIDFPFLKGLSYRFTMNAQRNNAETDTFTDAQFWIDTRKTSEMENPYMYSANANGKTEFAHTTFWNMDNIITYTKDFGKHHIDAMIGYTREASNKEVLKSVYAGFELPTILGTYGQDLASSQKIARLRTRWQAVGYLARLNYSFNNRYFLSANFRRDGFSAFTEGNKWSDFPGVSVAWTMSQEEFMKKDWLSFLKLRLSYGQNGNRSVDPYATVAEVSKGYTVFGSNSYFAMYPSALANKTLKWATTETWNLGFDFGFIDNRLNGTIDIYKSETKNMLLDRSLPYMTGYTTSKTNAGRVANKGVEVTLNSVNINGDGKNALRWESGIVFSLNRNEIVELFGKDWQGKEANDISSAITYGYNSAFALVVGKSITSVWDYKKLGIFQSQEEIDNYKSADGKVIQPDAKPGDIKFEDHNGDGKIDSAGDRYWIGDQDPLFTMNIANTLSYKNFSLYFNFRWNAGNSKHYLGSDPYGNYHNTATTTGAQLKAEPWSTTNPTNDFPRLGYTDPYKYYYWAQREFLKLKDITLSYTFDQPWVKKANIQNLRLYVSGTDLFTITNWTGLDPENGGTVASGPASSTYGSSPVFRTFSIGANITF